MKSKLFSLGLRDFIKGAFIAVGMAVVTFAYKALKNNTLFAPGTLKAMGLAALGALIVYLFKNFVSNSNDQIMTKEPKVSELDRMYEESYNALK